MKKQSTKADFDYDMPLHRRFELQAALYPERIALVFEEVRLSYRELNERANQLAHHLRQLHVGPEKRVGILLDRNMDLIIAILGVLKAGGAYVPLDPNYPQDRLSSMFADCMPELLITQQTLLARVESSDINVCCLDLDSHIAMQSIENPELNVNTTNLAYIIYTSGSTGKPKGCLTQHGNVMRLWAESKRIFSFNASDIWTLFHSCTFDFSVWEIWGPLLHGGTLVIVPYTVSRSPDAFYELLVREKVTVLNQTPSAFFQLMRFEGTQAQKSLCLRFIILGGEALNFQAITPWVKRYGLKKPHIINGYGPTETTIFATFKFITRKDLSIAPVSNLGAAIPHLSLYIVDNKLKPVSPGEAGEILIGGHGVARGYLNRPDLTAERFIKNPIPGEPKNKVYRTGDLARFMPDGQIEYLGRIDNQVKIRGFRIELGEIEHVLRIFPAVREAAVTVREDNAGEPFLAAYIVPEEGITYTFSDIRKYLMASLPDYMVPVTLTKIDSLPLTPNGKLDRKALPSPEHNRSDLEQVYVAPSSDLEHKLVGIYRSLLQIDKVGIDDNFFDLGGNSLSSIQLVENIKKELNLVVPVVTLFEYPTISALANYLEPKSETRSDTIGPSEVGRIADVTKKVAIIGMAGLYPGATNTTELWKNLCEGLETTSFFSDAELDSSLSFELRNRPNYVKARGTIAGIEDFDASFFGINPAEAQVMDPQHRLFLQTSWEALENAGYAPDSFAALHAGWIGVYGGVYNNTYYAENVITRPDLITRAGEFQTMTATEKDYVAMRVSHKLNLKGPSVTVHTACSTSLVAISQAYFALISHQCNMALAGGAAVTVPQNSGHLYTEDSMLSIDGHTRTFDVDAKGTVFSDGVGVVVLKRLEDAQKDGDTIYGVIIGAGVNNDGGQKMSFTAPSVEGQASVITYAQNFAGVSPEDISYVEAHGTATPLGDPIEVEALIRAFRMHTDKKQFCALGSIKSNFGHTTIAAGVAGVIKTVLALKHEQIPPSINYHEPNPKIDFANSPFFVNARLAPWPKGDAPRRAGVSSFGVGGTNAHIILEEAPDQSEGSPSRFKQFLPLSAKSLNALNTMTKNLCDYLKSNPSLNLADIAYTLQTGRKHFAYQRLLICDSIEEAILGLEALDPSVCIDRVLETRQTDVVSMLPELEAQYDNIGSLWQAGIDINWQAFYANETRHRLPLPTYPFEKKRVWIDRSVSIDVPIQTNTGVVVMDNQKTQILSMLREVLEDTTGINIGEFDNATTFFEMGMDSLLLTQVVTDLVGQFKVKIMFRQLLEELDTLDKLSEYLGIHMPEQLLPQSPVVTASVKSSPTIEMQDVLTPMVSSTLTGSVANKEDIRYVVSQQLQLMNRQLELLNSSLTPLVNTTAPTTTSIPPEESVPPKSFGAMARVTTTKIEKKLNAAQEEALNKLVASYCKKTALSKKMSQDNREVLADPRIVSGFRPEIKELVYQIHTIKSSGSHLWDVDGNEYVDMTCGFGTNFFGYVPEFVTKAIKEQLDKGMEIGPSHPLAGDVARMICEFTRAERVAFCSTGSEAVLAAMRLARTVSGRKIIVSFTNDYHGLFDEVVVRGNKKLRTTPAAPGIMPSCVENILVLEYGSPESLQIIRERAADIAGVLVEPVQSRDPALQPKEYLQEMRKLTQEQGICLIFDEVITGFRVARGGAQEYFGILADLGTYGKVIGGGLPMGVVAGKKEWMDALDGGSWQFGDESAPTVGMTYFAGTYVRHPLALAAAKAVLDYLKKEPTIQAVLANKTTKLVNELNAWCQQVSAPIHLSHFSSMYRLNYTQDLPYGDLLYVYMRERGINIWEHRPCFMTAAHSDKDIELIIKAFKESVMIMQAKEFMPGNPSLVMSEVNTHYSDAVPHADAKLGRDPNGNPAWYVADPNNPGKFTKVEGKE